MPASDLIWVMYTMGAHKHQGHIFVVARNPQSAAALAALAAVGAPCGVTVSQWVEREGCLQQLWRKPCGVLIADLDKDAALETVTEARRIWPWQTCIVLVKRGAVSHAVAMAKAGAAECLEKPVAPKRLQSAIRQGLEFAATLFNSGVPLTRTELKVLHLILAGGIAKDIAGRLGCSKRTIDVHRNNIFRKVGAKSCADIVKWAMSMGFLGGASNHLLLHPTLFGGPAPSRRNHPLPVGGVAP
jgi:two-component system invasion response regulator UvrY